MTLTDQYFKNKDWLKVLAFNYEKYTYLKVYYLKL
jgi:hypothetical protein